jgi:hypothetical protein
MTFGKRNVGWKSVEISPATKMHHEAAELFSGAIPDFWGTEHVPLPAGAMIGRQVYLTAPMTRPGGSVFQRHAALTSSSIKGIEFIFMNYMPAFVISLVFAGLQV